MKKLTAFLTSLMLIACMAAFPVQAENILDDSLPESSTSIEETTQPSETQPTNNDEVDDAPALIWNGDRIMLTETKTITVGETYHIQVLPHPTRGKATKVVLYENYTSNNEYIDWNFDVENSELIIKAKKATDWLRVTISVPGYAFSHEFILEIKNTVTSSEPPTAEPTQPDTSNIKSGDINSDGEVGVTDAISLQKYLLNMTTYNSAQWQAADLNKDDEVDVYDLGLLKQTLLHKIDIYNYQADNDCS